MSAIIYFTSGKELPITEKEFSQIAPKLQLGGIRLYRTGGKSLIPLNSTTMELIEYVEEPVEIIESSPPAEPVQEKKVESAPIESTTQEKQKSALESMIEKSNCKHEPEKLKLYMQSTAKGIRYFPVCSFCGKRERYVSEKKVREGLVEGWTAEDIDSAQPYSAE